MYKLPARAMTPRTVNEVARPVLVLLLPLELVGVGVCESPLPTWLPQCGQNLASGTSILPQSRQQFGVISLLPPSIIHSCRSTSPNGDFIPHLSGYSRLTW